MPAAGVQPGSPSLWGSVGDRSLLPCPKSLLFLLEAGWGVVETTGAFGILLTSEVRQRQNGDGGSSASERRKRGALDPKGVLLQAFPPLPLTPHRRTPFLKSQRPPWERPRRMNHPRFLPPPGPGLPVPRI